MKKKKTLSPQAQESIKKLEEYKLVLEMFGKRSSDSESLYSVQLSNGKNRYSLGTQVRHVLDYYQNLLNGFDLEKASDFEDGEVRIDYQKRERNQLIEKNIEVALEKIDQLIENLRRLCEQIDDNLLIYQRNNAEENKWQRLDFAVALQNNCGHAVHHAETIKSIIHKFYGDFKFPSTFEIDTSTQKKKL